MKALWVLDESLQGSHHVCSALFKMSRICAFGIIIFLSILPHFLSSPIHTPQVPLPSRIISNKSHTMAPKLSIRKPRWLVIFSKAAPAVERKEGKGLSVSQDETASDSSSSFQPEATYLDDFALPMWDNPLNASEQAVVKNANHPGATRLFREVQTFPKPTTRPQSTPLNMLITFGKESTIDDDLTVTGINSGDSFSEDINVSLGKHENDPSLDFNSAMSLQEDELIRLAMKRSLYDV